MTDPISQNGAFNMLLDDICSAKLDRITESALLEATREACAKMSEFTARMDLVLAAHEAQHLYANAARMTAAWAEINGIKYDEEIAAARAREWLQEWKRSKMSS